ncbi:glutamate carboxypeptidase [Glacieibacterium sp.]|uniref:glutamate carboxypeptidase n=1 Tax=Glacieibacterium sp. TaxID=2860237 RepID=UPI003B00873D
MQSLSLAGAVALLAAVATPAAAKPDAKLLAAATAARPEQLKLLETIVNIDSGTGDVAGGTKVGAILIEQLKALGATVRTVPAEIPGLPDNIVATVTGTGKTRILMIGHLDTVFEPGTAARWPYRVEGDRAHGPGVGDEKGGVVQGITALKLLKQLAFRDFAKITILIESSEERGSPGTRKLIASLLADHDVELNLEPGDAPDKVTVWRKGSTVLTIDVTGKAAHAGVAPQDGRNAAVELLHQLGDLDAFPHTGDGLTVNLTMMQAGKRNNIIPDHASATFSVRNRVPAQIEEVVARLEKNAQTVAVPGTTATIKREAAYPPLATNAATDALASRATAIYADLGRKLGTGGNGGASQSALAAAAGLPALDGLGPAGGNFHSDGEYIDLTTVTPRLYLLTALIMQLGKQGAPPRY